jgi:spermidine synthase
VGLLILNHLGKRFGKENIRLYRDDGLAIIKSKSARLLDKTRKELHKLFEQNFRKSAQFVVKIKVVVQYLLKNWAILAMCCSVFLTPKMVH